MSPDDLKRLNIAHFQRVLSRTMDDTERVRINALIDEERAKADTAYPKPKPPSSAG